MSTRQWSVRRIDESMRYAILIYLNEAEFYSLSKEDQNRVHRECGAWHESLLQAGKSLDAIGLQPAASAKILREKKGKPSLTDGPFPETKEVIGGLEIVECESPLEALAIAQRFPGLRAGLTVELRPLVPGNKCEAV